MKKGFVLAGIAGALMLGSTMNVMAAGEPSLCGHPLTEDYRNVNDQGVVLARVYQAIIPGGPSQFAPTDITFADGWKAPELEGAEWLIHTEDWFNPQEGGGQMISLGMEDASGANQDSFERIWLWTVSPDKVNQIPEEYKKFILYLDGNNQTQAQMADNGHWESNDKGWWIQYNDGHYLTNSWWQSPTSGLWYYMGADGYMVTNTVIDGYTINADGAWVQ